MINGVNAYQQTVNLQQLVQSTGRENQTFELRDRDRNRDDTTVSRTRTESLTRSNSEEQTREERNVRDLDNLPTQAAGKDAGLRRGSLLDVTV